MARITFEEIPETLLEDDELFKSRPWFPTLKRSATQSSDLVYLSIKTHLVQLVTNAQRIHWNVNEPTVRLDINVDSLDFRRHTCMGCGIMAETPDFSGTMYIHTKTHKTSVRITTFSGSMRMERWCTCGTPNEQIPLDEPDFLFSLYVNNSTSGEHYDYYLSPSEIIGLGSKQGD